MNPKPGMVRSWPEAIAYGLSMLVLSIGSTVLLGWTFGALVAIFVRAFRWTYFMFIN